MYDYLVGVYKIRGEKKRNTYLYAYLVGVLRRLIVFHASHLGLRQYSRSSSKALRVSSLPCIMYSSSDSSLVLGGHSLYLQTYIQLVM